MSAYLIASKGSGKIEHKKKKELASHLVDELGFWEKFCPACPWRIEKNPVLHAGEYYCMAIVWQSGQTRPCAIEQCAPYYFVKALAMEASKR